MTDQASAASADAGNAAAAAAQNAGAGENQNNGAAQNNGAQNNGDANSQRANNNQSIAAGGEGQAQQSQPYWPEDWRVKMAEHASAGDKKLYEKELKRLESMADPTQVYGSYRSIENTWASRKFIKLPGEGATEAEMKEFHKGLGVPETPEDYFKSVKLENGAVIGEADKPIVDAFAQAVHKAGAPPQVVNAALNWYFKQQEDQAAALDDADDAFRREATATLKEQHGAAFKRKVNATSTLFNATSGGPDVKNPNSFYARLLGGRTADGKVIGDDPEFNNWLIGLAQEINPAMTVVEDGDQSGKSIESEIKEIEQIMKTDRPRYNKEFAGRYTQLLEARTKIQSRQRA